MNIIIAIVITALVTGTVCWLGGAKNARRTIELEQAAKAKLDEVRG